MANTVQLSYTGAEINRRLAQVMKNVSDLSDNFEKDREFRENFANSSYVTSSVLSNYALKTELPDVSNFATKEELGKLFDNTDTAEIDSLIEVINILNEKYDAGQIANLLNDYLTEADAANLYQPKGNYQAAGDYVTPGALNDYATMSYVSERISALLNGVDADHDTLKEIVDLLNEKQDAAAFISSLASKADKSDLNNYQPIGDYATKDELDDYQPKGEYLTEHQSLADYALKSEIPTVPTKVSAFENDANYLTEHQDLSSYALKSEIPTVPTKVSAFENDANYLTEHQDLSSYALKTDLNNYQPAGEYITSEEIAYKANVADVYTKIDADAKFQPAGEYVTESNLNTLLDGYQPAGQYSTEEYVNSKITEAIDNVVGGASAAFDTLGEIASYIAGHEGTGSIVEILGTKANKSDLDNYQPKGDYLTEHQDLSAYALKSELPDVSGFITEHQDLSAYALKSEIPTVPTNVSAFENDANYLTEHQSLEDYALKTDLDNYVEKKLSETDSFNLIYDETTWNDSYENGALYKYYTKYPDEDLWSVELQRTATFNDKCYDVEIYSDATCETLVKNATLKASWETSEIQKVTDTDAGTSYYTVKDVEVDGIYELFSDNINSMSAGLFIKVKGISFPGFTQCWDGAVKAPGAKYPWVAVYFDEDVNSLVKFQYEGKDDVYPWGSKIFGKGNGHKEWGFASVAEEFKDNSFLIPENAANANPEWDGEAGTQSTFDISKFKVILVNQEDANSVKDYVVSEIARVEAEIPTVPTNVSAFENDANYLTEHQSLVGYATEQYVDEKISYLLDGVDENFDTLKELADVLTDEDTGLGKVNDALNDKANVVDVYDKTAADGKFVDKAKYDELNDKYTTLFNVVYSNATGETATALNADYVANNLSNENTSVEITEGELGDVTIPETTKAMTVTAPMQDESTITLSSPKAFTLINTSENPVDVTIDAPAGTSIPTMSLSGDFENLTVNNGTISAKSGEAPLTVTNVVINNDLGKNATVSGVEFNDNATITSDNVPSLGVANNNTDQNAPNATINAENSTVTLNKGQWNTLNTTVSDETLIVTNNAHINTLNVVKGNVMVYDREIGNRIDNVVNNTEYTVSLKTTDVTTGTELNSAMTGNPGIVNMKNDISRGRIGWGIFGSGNYLLDLQGHTLTISDATFGIKTRNLVNLKIVDTVGGGKFINDQSYGLWAGENTVITVDVPESTEIVGTTHTLYCEGSGKPAINVINGTYKLLVSSEETDVYDANGNYKFMLNHLDATYTREGNCFNITGGTFYGFDPARMNGDPGAEYSMIDLNAYESQVVDTFVDSRGTTMNVYKVVKK